MFPNPYMPFLLQAEQSAPQMVSLWSISDCLALPLSGPASGALPRCPPIGDASQSVPAEGTSLLVKD